MDNIKISRKAFLALVFGGFLTFFVSQLPAGAIFAQKPKNHKGNYGNSAYGG